MAARIPELAGLSVFRDLPAAAKQDLEDRLQPMSVQRGETLVRQGDMADALYVVVTGRFEVLVEGRSAAVAELGAGEPIGEIAFFAGGQRTATLKALRDSVVLKLDRNEFDVLAQQSPAIWTAITATLAQRLAATTAAGSAPTQTRPRTISIIRAGAAPVPQEFMARLEAAFQPGRVLLLDEAGAGGAIDWGVSLTRADEARWFNEIESRFDTVIYAADDTLTAWSEKAIRQSDLVLCVGRAGGDAAASTPSELETFAAKLHKPNNMRLVLLHDAPPPFSGTRTWLAARPWVGMHHHVVAGTPGDTARLARFINGTALGLVACGGGAFSASHIGIYQALIERGFEFDILGGTSGGAAMTAAFVKGAGPDEIERVVREIFVTRRAMRRWTWPRYGLLDPRVLEAGLAEYLGDIDIEDLPRPFFAVATNLTRNETVCLKRGPLWQAVRASSSIPALLPPVIASNGDILVDGCLRENVPIDTMHRLKGGPNIVLDFQLPMMHGPGANSAQSKSRLGPLYRGLASLSRPGLRRMPQGGPSAQAVLMRSLMLQNEGLAERLGPEDHLLLAPMPDGIAHLDWHRHADLRRHAYQYARRALADTAPAWLPKPETPKAGPSIG